MHYNFKQRYYEAYFDNKAARLGVVSAFAIKWRKREIDL